MLIFVIKICTDIAIWVMRNHLQDIKIIKMLP